ncbi:MAG: hypothetical protein MK085_03070 [Phycisphaerales bacterium]|nr:hypothetical protein [Phycisphaerales bacterium]
MDDRLKEVQTSDLTDSRLNHEFVGWLKTKGLNYLLAILLVACAFLGWDLYLRRGEEARNQAWADLASATMPQTLVDSVAREHADIDSVANIALLRAADTWLQAVRTNTEPGLAGEDPVALTPERRTELLAMADDTYADVLARGGKMPGFAGKPFVMAALFGQAAVAESRGEADQARGHLEQVVVIAEPEYSGIGAQAKSRLEDLDTIAAGMALPGEATLASAGDDETPFTIPVADRLLEVFEPEPDPNVGPLPQAPSP